ncbi:MAG: zinc ribbon domain-containing protein [Verrucomicrobiae bacterium]|nr:zinc ribbon domain-containing protein [Verrucomicrobiae bacterium]
MNDEWNQNLDELNRVDSEPGGIARELETHLMARVSTLLEEAAREFGRPVDLRKKTEDSEKASEATSSVETPAGGLVSDLDVENSEGPATRGRDGGTGKAPGDDEALDSISTARLVCPHCGGPLSENTSFCGQCGRKVDVSGQDEHVCRFCRAALNPNAKFCGACGHAVDE